MDYDFAIIGGGSAGYAAARTAVGLGLKTIVIEGGEEVGGLCILRGCMPSKTLIESANRFMAMNHAGEFGLSVGQMGFDGVKIIERKRRLIGEFAQYRREQLEDGGFDFLRGRAVFIDPHAIEIKLIDGSRRSLTARAFLVATGSVISTPPVPGLTEACCLTSDDLLDLAEIPESVIVLGAGAVGLEMAHYLNGLGRQVTVIQRSGQVLKGVDDEVAAEVEAAFRKRGVGIYTNTKLRRVECDGEKRRVIFEHEGEEKVAEAVAILNALGRRPNISGLGFDSAGVGLLEKMIQLNNNLQTTVPHIFAAGDCAGPFEVVHIAVEQGELAARNVARVLRGNSDLEEMSYRLKLYVVFTEPQVAVVGLSEVEAKSEGRDILTASYRFDDHGKSIVMGETEGLVKLVVDPVSREILGGVVVGPHASDLIHEIVVAMHYRATAGQLAAIPHYHPTLSEIWTYPAAELAEG